MVTRALATGGGVPDAGLLLPAGRVHPVCMALGRCSLQAHQPSRVGRQRLPAYLSGHAFTIQICRIWRELSARYKYATDASLMLDGARRHAHRSHHISPDFSRSNARGRSDLRSPHDAWTSQTHENPGIRQDRRGMSAASSPFRQNGDSRLAATGRSGFRKQIDGLG